MSTSMKSLFFTFSSSVTAGNTFDCTGFGFQPKAYLLFWNGRTESSDTVGLLDSQVGVGAGVSTSSRAMVNAFYDQGTTTALGGTVANTDAVLKTCDASAAVTGAIDHNSFLSDGIRFIVDDQLVTDLRVMIVAFGGDDITNAAVLSIPSPASTGDEDYTGAGFDPGDDSVCFFFGQHGIESADGGHEDPIGFNFGAARTLTGGIQQYSTVVNSDDDSATMDTDSYTRSGECIGGIAPGGAAALNQRATFVQSITDGIRLNYSITQAETRRQFVLIIKGGQWHLGDLLTQTDTTTDIVESGFGFQPRGALFVSHCQSESAANTTQAGVNWSVGSCTSTSDEICLGMQDENGTGNMETEAIIEHDNVYASITAGAGIKGLMHAISFPDSDGFTMEMSDAETSQTFVWYVAAGDAAAADVTATPSTLALVTAAFAPTIKHQIVVPKLSIATATFAPQLRLGVIPGTASLALTAFAPTVINPKSATPTTVALVTASFAPSVTVGQRVTPDTASLSLTTFAPVIRLTVIPGTAALTTTAFAPVIRSGIIVPVASLVTASFAPTVSTSDNKRVVPATLALVVLGFEPAVTGGAGVTATPGTVALVTAVFAPTVTATANVRTVPGVLALTLSTFAPTVSAPRLVTPGFLGLTLTTFAPTVGGAVTWCAPGVPFLYTQANWGTVTFAYEVYYRANPNTGRSRLFDKTASLTVPGSELSTTNTALVRNRSGVLVLTDGHEYEPQFGSTATDHTSVESARLVVI